MSNIDFCIQGEKENLNSEIWKHHAPCFKNMLIPNFNFIPSLNVL